MKDTSLIKKLIKNLKNITLATLVAGTVLTTTGCVVDWSNIGKKSNDSNKIPQKDIKEETTTNASVEKDPNMKYQVAKDIEEMATNLRKIIEAEGSTLAPSEIDSNHASETDYYGITMPDTLSGETISEETFHSIETKDNVGGNVTTPGEIISQETTTNNTPSTTTSHSTTQDNSTTTTKNTSIDFNQSINLIKKSMESKLSEYALANKVSTSAIPKIDDILFIKPTNNYIQIGFIDKNNSSFVTINFSNSKSSTALANLNKFNTSNTKADADIFAQSCISCVDTSTIKPGNIKVSTMVTGINNAVIAEKTGRDKNSSFIVCFENVDPIKTSNGFYEYKYEIIVVSGNSISPMEIIEEKIVSKSKLSRNGLQKEINEVFGTSNIAETSLSY